MGFVILGIKTFSSSNQNTIDLHNTLNTSYVQGTLLGFQEFALLFVCFLTHLDNQLGSRRCKTHLDNQVPEARH